MIRRRWALQKQVSAIPGTGNPDHMEENLAVHGFSLSDAEMATIDAVRRQGGAKGRLTPRCLLHALTLTLTPHPNSNPTPTPHPSPTITPIEGPRLIDTPMGTPPPIDEKVRSDPKAKKFTAYGFEKQE